jgi:hypothetical protein
LNKDATFSFLRQNVLANGALNQNVPPAVRTAILIGSMLEVIAGFSFPTPSTVDPWPPKGGTPSGAGSWEVTGHEPDGFGVLRLAAALGAPTRRRVGLND